MHRYNLLVVLGPTASGKTRLGVELARRLSGEVISADSRQVYREMDLGTGKDLVEYGEIPHHLIDIVPPGSEFSSSIPAPLSRGLRRHPGSRAPAGARGGNGMYLDAALGGYRLREVPENPALRDELDRLSMAALTGRLRLDPPPAQHHRPAGTAATGPRHRNSRLRGGACTRTAPPASQLHLRPPPGSGRLRRRITLRLRERLDQGMVEEVRARCIGTACHGKSWNSTGWNTASSPGISRGNCPATTCSRN